MDRKIKFRAWDEEEKVFSLPGGESMPLIRPDGTLCDDYGDEIDDDYIIEPSTGLTDKNGKEIYAGDIFRNTINGGTWRVYWNKKDAAFWVDSGISECRVGEFDWDRSDRKYGFIKKNCEVIGNIHENPELLGGEK